jgi:hypothetical protein
MALIVLGSTRCPLCNQLLQEGQDIVATTAFINAKDHPLWRYSDVGMHRACFRRWEHREFFASVFNDACGAEMSENGKPYRMDASGAITAAPEDDDGHVIDHIQVSRAAHELDYRHGRHAHCHACILEERAELENDGEAVAFWRAVASSLRIRGRPVAANLRRRGSRRQSPSLHSLDALVFPVPYQPASLAWPSRQAPSASGRPGLARSLR